MKGIRILFITVLLVSIGVIAYRAAPRLDLAWLSNKRSDWKLAYAPRADVSTAYLPGPAWMTFSLPTGVQQIKLITAPNTADIVALRAQRLHDPLQRWKYALDIEAVDALGRPTMTRTHHLRTDLTEILDPEGRTITPTFHLQDALTPLGSAVIHLNFAGLPDASRIRVRLRSKDSPLVDVSLRMYVPEKVSDRQINHLWSRLSAARKDRLAKGNVFSPELLLESEKRNLLRNSWQPIGPLGTRGVDFRQRDLYVLNDYQGEPSDDPIPPAGLSFGGRLWASIPLPEQGGPVRLALHRVSPPGSATTDPAAGIGAAADIPIEIRWRGPGPYARSREVFTWRAATPEFRGRFDGGTLELAAPEHFTVRAYLGDGDTAPEITPGVTYERSFVVTAGTTLDYPIRHDAGTPTPVRLTLRHLRTAAQLEMPSSVEYSFLDAHDAPLRQGRIDVTPVISPYDRVFGEPVDVAPTVPVVRYFAVPENATRLRLQPIDGSTSPILVSVANRPAAWAHQSRLPADRFDYDPGQERLPVWFSLRPAQFETLLLAGRSRLLSIQARAPDVAPELLSGDYHWQDLPPDGSWVGRQLLTPREPGTPWREDALPATYVPLRTGQSRSLDLPTYRGQRVISPRLAWVATGDTPWFGELWVDGQLHQHLRGGPGYGEMELLPLPAGRHRVRIASSRPLRLLLSHARPERDAYVARLTAPTAAKRTYTADLHGGEGLTLRLFGPSGSARASRLRIRIEGPPPPPMFPLDAWLLQEREVTLRPAPAVGLPVFDTDGQTVDAGQPIFLPIPTHAAGRYRIHVEHLDGPGGHLLLTRLSTRPQAGRRLLLEPAWERHLEIRE